MNPEERTDKFEGKKRGGGRIQRAIGGTDTQNEVDRGNNQGGHGKKRAKGGFGGSSKRSQKRRGVPSKTEEGLDLLDKTRFGATKEGGDRAPR